jgi:hypothetical protein
MPTTSLDRFRLISNPVFDDVFALHAAERRIHCDVRKRLVGPIFVQVFPAHRT